MPSRQMLAVPPDLLAEIEGDATNENLPVADVLRDVIERGLGERRWQARLDHERRRADALGLHDADDECRTRAEDGRNIRKEIAQGVRSLREGSVIDGPAFMARMDAELERQARE